MFDRWASVFPFMALVIQLGADSCADAGFDSERCTSAADRRLSWRARSYGAKGQGAWRVYGDDFAASSFAGAGFNGPVDGDDWDVLWTHWPSAKDLKEATLASRKSGRLVNNCVYFLGAGQKCKMAGHVRAVQRALGRRETDESHHPKTYVLMNASHVEAWQRELAAEPRRVWLVKKCVAGMSQGIQLVSGSFEDVQHVKASLYTWSVAQRYIDQPYLGWGGSKFHMRLYVLVTSWHPPHVFLYDEGFIFRSRHKYVAKSPTLSRDVFSGVSADVENLPLSAMWDALGEYGRSVRERIKRLLAEVLGTALVESFGSAEALQSRRGYGCFDLYGVDVMIDKDLKPFLLEINPGPNLWIDKRSSVNQTAIKGLLVHQVALWAHKRLQKAAHGLPADEAYDMLLNFTQIV